MGSTELQQPAYSIGVVARLTGISVHTLRLWERRYGLGASRRSEGGQRIFTQVDLDHLLLIKQLLDRGLKIGDIARLPRKTLSGLAQEHCGAAAPAEAARHFRTVVFGSMLTRFFRHHAQRYPRLQIEFPQLSLTQWARDISEDNAPALLFVQIDSLHRAGIKAIEGLCLTGATIFLHYQFSNSTVLQRLRERGVTLVKGGLDQERIDELVNRGMAQQARDSALHRSAHKFSIPLPETQQALFSPEQLMAASEQKNHLQCECPSHLAELITALNAFEQYSLDCESDNWRDAAVHACIYSYTVQARNLMERALLAVMSEEAS